MHSLVYTIYSIYELVAYRISIDAQPKTPITHSWEAQLARLVAYKAEHGDCNVPQGWAEDRKLATWVHTQRRSEGMTEERAATLTVLGFIFWSAADVAWEAQLARLAAYKAEHGDCGIPRRRRGGAGPRRKGGSAAGSTRSGSSSGSSTAASPAWG
jgi:hypothetical protein